MQALDGAVQKNLPWVTEAVMDKNYMGQLVAVQHQRGAKGGELFADALNLNLANHRKVHRDRKPSNPGILIKHKVAWFPKSMGKVRCVTKTSP